MKHLLSILLLCSAFQLRALDYVTWTMTVTNGSVTNDAYYINGSARIGATNRTSTTWSTNSSVNWTTTNIFSQFGGWPIAGILISNVNTNVLIFKGVELVMTASNFATLTASTQAIASPRWTPLYPFSAMPSGLRVTNGNETVNGVNNATNEVNAYAPSMLLFPSLTNRQTIGNKIHTNSLFRGGTNDGVLITNTPAGYFTNFYAQVINPDGSTSLLTGTISGGKFIGTSGTNMPWLNATNANIGTARIDTLTVWTALTATNFSSPGSGTSSLQLGNTSASGEYSISIGVSAQATNSYTVAVGYDARALGVGSTAIGFESAATTFQTTALGSGAGATAAFASAFGQIAAANHSNSTAIGYAATTTTTNQVRLGTASEHVSIPGEIRSVIIKDQALTGTNRFDAAISRSRTNITSVANGANDIDPGLANNIKLSGPTASFSIDKVDGGWDGREIRFQHSGSYTLTIVNNSGAGVLGDAAKILTGTGGDVTLTNNPKSFILVYDSEATRWVLDWKSN